MPAQQQQLVQRRVHDVVGSWRLTLTLIMTKNFEKPRSFLVFSHRSCVFTCGGVHRTRRLASSKPEKQRTASDFGSNHAAGSLGASGKARRAERLEEEQRGAEVKEREAQCGLKEG